MSEEVNGKRERSESKRRTLNAMTTTTAAATKTTKFPDINDHCLVHIFSIFRCSRFVEYHRYR